MTTLSVIIPNFNRAHLIGETLENVLRQSRPPDEVIVVDDGSTDGSSLVIERFAPRVRLIRQANAGPGAARNRGLAEARGELIQFMDSDDLWSPNKLEVQERALAQSGADFAYSPWLQTPLEGRLATQCDPVLQQSAPPQRRSLLSWFLRGWLIVFQSCLVRRALLERVGPYRTDMVTCEDVDLLFRMLLSGARGVHVPEALLVYRLHGPTQLSWGATALERMARDRDRFTSAVDQALKRSDSVSVADRAAWAHIRRRAMTEVARFDPHAEVPCRLQRLLDAAARGRQRALGKLRGSPWGEAFQAGPLTKRQALLLDSLGYRAARTPSVL